ncbi:hypothetical protein NDU88_003048 [Pleurodeles waltl]|uniref:Uncharacterized protein n=1 Tax=Pleurodeles waltl TaxID=8319 RepID=A0AAV7W2C5_PLEWA|nr:hypothetical protein NDU88_003048 [Pleurodeles waltl]
MLCVLGLRHAPPARLPNTRAWRRSAHRPRRPRLTTRPRSDEPRRTLQAAHLGAGRQSQVKHQGPKWAAALI